MSNEELISQNSIQKEFKKFSSDLQKWWIANFCLFENYAL